MECDGESHEVEEVKDGKTLGEEDGEPVKEVEMKDAGGGEDEDCRQTHAVKKPKKSCLKCHDCGKTFPRREAYDLHRHFHMHQEEQASLTCKECGLTFQHRSSLIKHRSEHKRNGMPEPSSVSPRRSHQRELREEKGYACDSCGELFASLIRYKLHACQVSLEKPYRCPLCRKEFQYRVSINAHMQSHSLDSPYRCLECNKGFQCAVTLHIHQRSHAALKPYECPDCGMVFRHRSLMDDHRRKHTEERPHQCTICCKSFKYSSLLQQHQYLHTGQKPYRCAECGKRFALAQNMRAHCRQHKKRPSSIFGRKSNDMPNGADFKTIGKENTSNDLEQKRNCPLCPQLFYRAADLRAHMLSHEAEYENQQNLGKTSANVYTCSICQLQFPDESALQSHELTHQVQTPPQKREALSVASATSGNNSAEGDWVDQSEKKPLKCKDCGKSFHYRSVLELHMRIHNRGYQCHVCKKSFRFSSYLQQHLIIHSGKKPYKCPDCGKDFAFLQNMKTHQRLHQQKPFRCTQCRKGYSDESQLQRHMLCHSGEKPYKCNLCNKSFGLAYLLRDHLNTHTGERPHRCQECHKSFPWLSSLLVHQKIHARKRQASQSYSSFIGSQRGRPSGLGRGKKSWPRMGESVEDSTALQQTPFSSQILQGTGPKPMEQESSAFDPEQAQSMPLKLQQQWQIQIASQLQQQSKWLSEGQTNKQPWQAGTHLKLILPKPDGLSKLPSHQQSPGWADVSQSAQAGTAPKKLSQDNGDTGLTSQFSPTSPSKAKSDQVQERQQQPLSRLSSTSKSPSKAEGHEDDAESDKPNNNTDKQPQEQQSTGLASSSIRMREEPDSASLNRNNKPLSVVMPLDMSKSSNIQDKPINEKGGQQPPRQIMHPASQQPLQLVLQPSQQIQLLQQAVQQMQPEQLNQMTTLQLLQQQFHQAQSNQLGSVSVQFGATSFTHSNGVHPIARLRHASSPPIPAMIEENEANPRPLRHVGSMPYAFYHLHFDECSAAQRCVRRGHILRNREL
ncbi:zinc finger protein 14 [Trichomycterus rosablanca]|uniref:zinc finger protein 14 n=1 Tax=Trichomycterus rosablanca TaxID=2290929 RepID=UPI002F356142